MDITIDSTGAGLEEIADVILGEPALTQWGCDIRYLLREKLRYEASQLSASVELSKSVNPYTKFVPANQATFRAPGQRASLSSLIRDDLSGLSTTAFWREWMADVKSLRITERFSTEPNAQIIRISKGQQSEFTLVFHSPIVWFLNAVTLEFCRASSFEPYLEECENMGRRSSRMGGENAIVITGFLKLLERLRTKETLQLEQDLPGHYLGSGFDLCERVEGARHLIVGHEMGHVRLLAKSDKAETIQKWQDSIRKRLLMGGYLNDVPEAVQRNWITECWCDAFGVMIALAPYIEDLETRGNRVRWTINRAINSVLGILFLFTQFSYFDLLRFVNSSPDGSLDNYDRDSAFKRYPPPEVRCRMLFTLLDNVCPWASNSPRVREFARAIDSFEEMVTSFFDIDWAGSDEARLQDQERMPSFRSAADIEVYLRQFDNVDKAISALNYPQFTVHDMHRLMPTEFEFRFCEEWRKYIGGGA